MNKKTEKKLNRVLLVLAIVSFIVTFAEGCFYYSGETYHNPLFRFMLILQNSIKAFGFKSTITIDNVIKKMSENPSLLEVIVGYAYAFATFTAPYCTFAMCYKFLEKLLRIKIWSAKKKNKKHIIIFGYNDEVKELLNNQEEEEQDSKVPKKIHLVSTDIPSKEELGLLKKQIVLHNVDCLKLSKDQLKYFFKQMELERAEDIILFEESSAKNFSLYNMFHREENGAVFKENVKFICRCEDDGIKRILEDYHDTPIREKADKVYNDLEIISIPEIRIRKMLKKNPLHSYYKNSGVSPDQWNLHLLIIGFGKMGQQLLLQAMNLGVVSSRNSILIDVIDNNIEEKKSIFANNFSEKYVTFGENEFSISPKHADGELRIRFHKMDIRYKEFQKQLKEYGKNKNGGAYTYIAICVKDKDINLHCMAEVERYLQSTSEADCMRQVKIGIRMDSDKQMASYLNNNEKTYKNVFAIEETISTITLNDLISDQLDAEAKVFNRIYNTISIGAAGIKKKDSSVKTDGDAADYWRRLELFRRNSSRALAHHAQIKSAVFDYYKSVNWKQLFDGRTGLLKKVDGCWVFEGTEEEFLMKLDDTKAYPCVGEFARMEHRRWCYFMASCGWKRTSKPTDTKSDVYRVNPCMCTWDELVKYQKSMCKYDLMPLLMKYEEVLKEEQHKKRIG